MHTCLGSLRNDIISYHRKKTQNVKNDETLNSKNKIFTHPEFNTYIKLTNKVFNDWKKFSNPHLNNFKKGSITKQLIKLISENQSELKIME